MKNTKAIYSLGLFLAICSCGGPSSADKEGYVRYLTNEDNGLLTTKEIGGYEFHLQYEPINYKVLKKVKDRAITLETYNEEIERFKGGEYYIFKIGLEGGQGDLLKHGAKSQSEYSERVQYFSTHMQNDFSLLQGEDSLKCNLFHFERTYGVSHYATFVLGFDNRDELKQMGSTWKELSTANKQLVYDDKAFGVGPIKYKISAKAINNIPELILEFDV